MQYRLLYMILLAKYKYGDMCHYISREQVIVRLCLTAHYRETDQAYIQTVKKTVAFYGDAPMIMTVMVMAGLGYYIPSFDCDKTIYTCKTTLTI